MKLIIAALYDSASQAFSRPFFVTHAGQAMRGFMDGVNRESESDVYRHPDDFTLFELGTFEDSTGQFETHAPVQLMRGKDAKQRPEPSPQQAFEFRS